MDFNISICRCITGYLKSKAVILVTHQIQFIKRATKILVLEDGKSFAYGTYDEIVNSGIDLETLVQKPTQQEQEKNAHQTMLSRSFSVTSKASRTSSVLSVRGRTMSTLSTISDVSLNSTFEPQIEEEEKQVGAINAQVYYNYITSGSGPVLLTMMILSTLVSQAIFHYNDIYLSEW